ncbi:unnamed protein product [Sphenostylis stenocarpa]|uniref:Polyadenylate-binding protein n=1 Tax=Sphenostylis stenocarpa TaxID=92480 RepID=A0AA86SDR8_9FABA|nr:unnamed protein product [Sphenostylis stenocarpa]
MAAANSSLAVPATALNGVQFGNASLYVGDLDANVVESQLFDLFSQVAQVVSIRVCRDQARRSSLGYAYVNLANGHDAANAMEHLNFTPLNGKPIRIMISHRDPSIRKSGYANVFIKNLDSTIDNKALHDTFAVFGTVLSSKVAVDNYGQSKGYGFVQFDNEESAQNAIKKLNGMLINDKKVYVGLFVRRQERAPANGSPQFTNVYVKNFSEAFTDEDLKQLFNTYGIITSAVVMKDSDGKSRGFGFVNFESPDSAAAAVEKLNGTIMNHDKVLYVARAQRKAEREAELKAKFEQQRKVKFEKLQGANLYLKNFDDSFTDEKLRELFSKFGTTTSCKVMVDALGHSKGCGFVAFSTPEEARKAINEMHGKMIGGKPLYVAVAQRKEERKASLQAHFTQLQVSGTMAPFNTGYHPATPRLIPPPLYFGQGTAPFIPSPQHTGYGLQQPFLSGMRPTSGVHPNFIVPYYPKRNNTYGRITAQRVGNLPPPPPPPHIQMNFSNQGMAVDNYNTGAISNTLASALASATPENQHLMLGENLYPLVEKLTSNNQTAKVTGMLLEMDQSEVIHLIESPEDLKIKVSEAVQVLNETTQGGTAEGGDEFGRSAH